MADLAIQEKQPIFYKKASRLQLQPGESLICAHCGELAAGESRCNSCGSYAFRVVKNVYRADARYAPPAANVQVELP